MFYELNQQQQLQQKNLDAKHTTYNIRHKIGILFIIEKKFNKMKIVLFLKE